MKSIYSFLIVLLFCFSINGQNEMKKLQTLQPINLDTISDINIYKTIYYENPIIIEYNNLKDSSFLPLWYNAYCVGNNIEFYNGNINEAHKFVNKQEGPSKQELINYNNKVKEGGGIKELLKKEESSFPFIRFLNIYGEVWFTKKSTNENFVLIQGLNKSEEIRNFGEISKLSTFSSEKIDSTLLTVTAFYGYSVVNDTVKFINQTAFFEKFQQGKYSIVKSLNKFKKNLIEKDVFQLSEMNNGKRLFKTMEKTNGSFRMIRQSTKPE